MSKKAAKAPSMILVYGSPTDGFTFIGPVEANDPAMEAWIERELRGEYWWYLQLEKPEWT